MRQEGRYTEFVYDLGILVVSQHHSAQTSNDDDTDRILVGRRS
jgi:hypothetical protein